jgi:hypothetical protein
MVGTVPAVIKFVVSGRSGTQLGDPGMSNIVKLENLKTLIVKNRGQSVPVDNEAAQSEH